MLRTLSFFPVFAQRFFWLETFSNPKFFKKTNNCSEIKAFRESLFFCQKVKLKFCALEIQYIFNRYIASLFVGEQTQNHGIIEFTISIN